MKQYNSVFLVGGPSSGKDFILRTALKESHATEIPLAKLVTRIREQEEYSEIDGRPLIINGNADQDVILCKNVLESMGYQTALIFVYTTNEASKSRSSINEDKRQSKYDSAIKNMHYYKNIFGEGFFLIDNSVDFMTCNEETQEQMIAWIDELTDLVEGFFNYLEKHPVAKPKEPHPVPHGYERVKDGSFNVLRKKKPAPVANQADTQTDGTGLKEDIDLLFEKEFPTIVDMIAQKKSNREGDKYKGGIAIPGNKATSREVVETNQEITVPQTQAKGVKYRKDRPAKGAKSPGDYLDSRVGMVPSAAPGLTGYKVDHVQYSKTLKQLREKKDDKQR